MRKQIEEQNELVREQQQTLLGAEEEIGRLSEQIIQQQTMAELERFRAVANETSKWEARERRLVQRIEELEARTATTQGSMLSGKLMTDSHCSNLVSGPIVLDRHSLLAPSCCTITTPHITASPITTSYIPASPITTPYIPASPITTPYISASPITTPYISASSMTTPHIIGFPTTTPQIGSIPPVVTIVPAPLSYSSSTSCVANALQAETAVSLVSSPPTHVTTSIPTHISADSPIPPREALCNPADPLSLALMAQQLPPLSKFNGDDTGGEEQGFTDWIEQLELIGEVC